MRTIWAGALTALALLMGGLPAGPAVAQGAEAVRSAARNEVSAQARRRPSTRIIVTPRRYSYPGPGAVRQCTSWLQPEYRPSGTVIVPQMRCWWEPG
jgi:hypothetical protein